MCSYNATNKKSTLNTQPRVCKVEEGVSEYLLTLSFPLMYKLNSHSTFLSIHMVLSNVALRSYYLAFSAVRSCPWAARRQCCPATQPRCPGNWRSRPCMHCSHHWRHWAGSLLYCAGKCCWWACSWPTYTWRDLARKEGGGHKKVGRHSC